MLTRLALGTSRPDCLRVCCSMSGAAFVTSFFRFGSGNVHGGNNFDLDGNTGGSDCNYTYSDTRGD